ncbi:uncharacterized protein [Dysidea avara]|uniref:uncharacterized protein isoform X1 n=1 Tax=Dysidea avara TaxID=196820 RepID=UPI00331D30DF
MPHKPNALTFTECINTTCCHVQSFLSLTAHSLNYSQDKDTPSTEPLTCYTMWISKWLSHLSGAQESILVPPEATRISTPLVPERWRSHLVPYPDKKLTYFFISGITSGFRLGCKTPLRTLKSSRKNLVSAFEHPEVVDEYLANELKESRIVGPFKKYSIRNAHISRFGVIPKKSSGKWRLIVDLSHPPGFSVNDAIPKELCSLNYITIDTAIKHILMLGPGTLLAKLDIKNAFRLLPIHPADRHLLTMRWNNHLYIDTCLPFGLRSAPKLFNILADLLTWLLERQGVSPVIHYLDDFLTMGPALSGKCQENLAAIQHLCTDLGIPLAPEKLEGPTTCLTFLGIEIDTHLSLARLPKDKLTRIKSELRLWLKKRRATKRQILSLVGLLQHASKVVVPGRTFTARMYCKAARVKKLHYSTKLNQGFRSDVHWWHTFISIWNGRSFLHLINQQAVMDHFIYTDASGSWGCGGFFNNHWFQYAWTTEWSEIGIMAKELLPIVISCVVWGPVLSRKSIEVRCDNTGAVSAINKGSSKDKTTMHLLRCLWFFAALFQIKITATHIPGIENVAADTLSRNFLPRFWSAYPQAAQFPSYIPIPLLTLLSPKQLDWTSPKFLSLFQETVSLVYNKSN